MLECFGLIIFVRNCEIDKKTGTNCYSNLYAQNHSDK